MSPLVKTIAFLFLFLYVLPFMTALCLMFPLLRHLCFAGMFYFTSNEYSMNILPMPKWTGTARGYAFSAVSLFAIPLLMSLVLDVRRKVRFFPPGWFFYFLYCFAILLSGLNAIHLHQWGFEVCKMFWMYITFLAAFNYLNTTKDLKFFIYLVCCILLTVFLIGVYQKYRLGKYQISSTFPHQNSLSLYLEIFGLLALGVLMNERISRLLFFLTLASFSSSLVLIIFTYSRGGLVVFFGGVAIVCGLSILFNGFSPRRLLLMLVGLVFVLSMTGYALPRIIQRFNKAPEASKSTRINLAIAAKRIANDYTFGVGANNFSEYSGPARNYAREMYVNATPAFLETSTGRGGIVETIYLLVAAECGWWGLGTLILWFLYYYFVDAINIFVLRKKPCSGIAIGIFGGLTCNYWHSSLEWSLKQYNNFAGQMIIYALIGVIAVNRKSIKAAFDRTQAQEKALAAKKRAASKLPPLIPPEWPTEKNDGTAQTEPEHVPDIEAPNANGPIQAD
jgi:hypothetical protein